jgi:hypothetical protein
VVPGQDSVLSIFLVLTPFGLEDFVDASMRSKLKSALSIKLQIPFSNITISDIQRLRRQLSRHIHGVGRQEAALAPEARSTLNPRVEISVQARVGPAGGDSAQIALAQLAKISRGDLDERIAAVFGKQDVSLTKACARVSLDSKPGIVTSPYDASSSCVPKP